MVLALEDKSHGVRSKYLCMVSSGKGLPTRHTFQSYNILETIKEANILQYDNVELTMIDGHSYISLLSIENRKVTAGFEMYNQLLGKFVLEATPTPPLDVIYKFKYKLAPEKGNLT